MKKQFDKLSRTTMDFIKKHQDEIIGVTSLIVISAMGIALGRHIGRLEERSNVLSALIQVVNENAKN